MVEVWNERKFDFGIHHSEDYAIPNTREVAPDWIAHVQPSPYQFHFTPQASDCL